MAFDKSGLDNYVDVATRIAEFREKYPDGRLRPADPAQPYRIETIGSDTFIVFVAAAYRGPDDTLPGIGTAQEVYPGKTPYTKGSEIQNAETSAWGRAIVAALAADTRKAGIASRDEVQNRQAERDQEWEAAQPANPDQAKQFDEYAQRVKSATGKDQITALGELVKDARGNNRISRVQYDRLSKMAAAKLAELDQGGAE